MSYRDARPLARAIASATASHAMPPWKAGPSDFPFANARQLTGRSDRDDPEMGRRRRARGRSSANAAAASIHGGLAARSSGPDRSRWTRRSKCRREVPDVYPQLRRAAESRSRHGGFARSTSGRRRAASCITACSSSMPPARRVSATPAIRFPGSRVAWAAGESPVPAVVRWRRPPGVARREWVERCGQRRSVARVGGSLGGWALGGRALELPSGLAFFVAQGIRSRCSRHTFIRPGRSSVRSRLSVSTSRRRRRRRPSPRSSCHQSSGCSRDSTYRPTKGTTRSGIPL